MDRLYISLFTDLRKDASTAAGWYVAAMGDQGQIITPTPISLEAAHQVADALQMALQSTDGEMPQTPITQLVMGTSALIRQALEEQLQHAEEQAGKIAMLRKRLAAIPKEVGDATN